MWQGIDAEAAERAVNKVRMPTAIRTAQLESDAAAMHIELDELRQVVRIQKENEEKVETHLPRLKGSVTKPHEQASKL